MVGLQQDGGDSDQDGEETLTEGEVVGEEEVGIDIQLKIKI